jgi:anti-sigma regulatory factor (Ser/Thr protein kinase)
MGGDQEMAVDVRLSPGPQAPAEARRSLEHLGRVDPELLERLRLLVSELVTNSVRHGGIRASDEIRLLVQRGGGSVRVTVIDSGKGFQPHPRLGERDAGSGWGLYLVEHLADRWGVHSNGVTTVWFEVDG